MDNWTVVTVTYNSAEHLRRYWSRERVGSARWIVVDNASTDDSVEVANSMGAEVISLASNQGFSAANNRGLAQVATDWVLFANPDVAVAWKDFPRLADVATANNALIAPQLVNPDGTDQPNARGLPFLPDKFANRSISLPGARLDDYARTGLTGPTYVAWAMGAAVAGRTDVIRSLGGWDESFFLYYEDHDIGLRAWSAGLAFVVDPSIRWVHEWQRETTTLRLRAWKREIPSAVVFYRRYPRLLLRSLFRPTGSWRRLVASVWRPAIDN